MRLADQSRLRLQLAAFLAFLVFPAMLAAQDGENRRPLDHEDYKVWNTISTQSLSSDGKWVLYGVRKGEEKTTLKIRHTESKREYSIENGSAARFSFDSQYVVYQVNPDRDLLKKLRKEKKKDLPVAKLEMVHLESGRMVSMDRVQSFQLPRKNGDWIGVKLLSPKADDKKSESKSDISETYQVTPEGLKRPEKKQTTKKKKTPPKTKGEKENNDEKKSSKKDEKPETEEQKPIDKEKAAGTTLVLRNLKTGYERRFENVVSFAFSENGATLVFATAVKSNKSTKSDPEADGVTVFNLEKLEANQVLNGLGNYRNLSVSADGKQVAFLTDRDDYATKESSWALYHAKSSSKSAKLIANEETESLPEGWWISRNAAPYFSENGRRLFFGTAPKPEPQPEEDEDAEPVAKLDLWHWQDPALQPQQLLEAERERRRSYLAVYDVRTRKVIQLATKEMPTINIDRRSESDVAVATSREKYRKMMSWDIQSFTDTHLVDLKTGKSRMLVERGRSGGVLSPQGNYVLWWDADSRSWMAISTKANAKPSEISEGIEHPLFNELHDTPSEPRPYGVVGWTEDDEAVIISDRYDMWQLDPSGDKKPICITQGKGRENRRRFSFRQLEIEQRFIDTSKPLMLAFFDESDKSTGFATLSMTDSSSNNKKKAEGEQESKEDSPINVLIHLQESLGGVQRAREGKQLIFNRSTFKRCPDIWLSTTDFKSISRISRINPQQQEYTWGTAELTQWKSKTGEELEGLLYKPDGFDPAKKYPLLVYFYERNSDNLHRYYAPAAGRSIINFSFYVSRGYVLFVPDIPYRTGFPGQSAADAILPGVKHIVKEGYIDEEKIGMQGHSWGGYQTAYLVTQTDMFACAESGAPVSNMTSAYGGIRWGTGMSRMFQYERTQSRIGETLWENRELYIQNSPVFHADKINTPLLILHNDEDGAVPWYQGIELFVALRRLEKPAWLMNYNGQPHWVMKPENRLDFAKRMQQFFDHYLMDAPMPEWMANGIPAVKKGKEFGFEPAEMEAEEESEESPEEATGESETGESTTGESETGESTEKTGA